MKQKNGREKEEMEMMRKDRLEELSENDLDQVVGGVITEAGADWLTDLIRQGKKNGSTMNNVMMLAGYSSGKGALAQTTPAEARTFIQQNWDSI